MTVMTLRLKEPHKWKRDKKTKKSMAKYVEKEMPHLAQIKDVLMVIEEYEVEKAW